MKRAWVLSIICLSLAVSIYPMCMAAKAAARVWELLYAPADQTVLSSVRGVVAALG